MGSECSNEKALCVKENKTNDCNDKSCVWEWWLCVGGWARFGVEWQSTKLFQRALPLDFLRTSNRPTVISRLLTIKESATLDRFSMSLPQLNILIKPFMHLARERDLRKSSTALPAPHTNRERKILFVMIFGRARKVSASQS